jgi:hypothetical protein
MKTDTEREKLTISLSAAIARGDTETERYIMRQLNGLREVRPIVQEHENGQAPFMWKSKRI